MPDELADFLVSLPNDVADKIWEWLDGEPHAVMLMIGTLLETHPKLSAIKDHLAESATF